MSDSEAPRRLVALFAAARTPISSTGPVRSPDFARLRALPAYQALYESDPPPS